jgi:hypothetical protein
MENFNGSSIDHLNIGVSDTDRSRTVYEQALAPLEIVLTISVPREKAESGGAEDAARFYGDTFPDSCFGASRLKGK